MRELYVCYCLLADSNMAVSQRQKLSEKLCQAQAYYELMARDQQAVLRQAFVYGNGQAVGRPFATYDFGFRAAMDEKVEDYPLTDVLLICNRILSKVMAENETFSKADGYKQYRVVWIADHPLKEDGEEVRMAVKKLANIKKQMAGAVDQGRVRFSYLDVWGNGDMGPLKPLIDEQELI